MDIFFVLGVVLALAVGFVLGVVFTGGTKYDGTIGLEQQEDGRFAVALHYDLDELYSKKKVFITLKVLEDRINPIVNNGKTEEKSTKEES